MNHWISIALISIGLPLSLKGQELLTKEQAAEIALTNNYNIQVAKNNSEIARNNTSYGNNGYIPSITGNAGANLVNRNTRTGIIDATSGVETVRENPGGNTKAYNASIGVNYVIFDGFGRHYNYQRLQEQFDITELQARQIIEDELLNLFTVYYEVARLTQDKINRQQTLEISRNRLKRARYANEYGQNSRLDLLNAEVDYNNDSISYMTTSQTLMNMKRDLNLFLGRDIEIAFEVDTAVTYAEGLTLDQLLQQSNERNATILQSQGQLHQSDYDIQIVRANAIPRITFGANYSWNRTDFDTNANPFGFQFQDVVGPQIGLTLTWNIFDGGVTRTRIQNARIAVHNQQIALEQNQKVLDRNVHNAWNIYQTALFVLQAERKNLETSKLNFDRSEEQYRIGQISSIQFRTAQINLQNSQQDFYLAQYRAKTAELALMRLSGNLIGAAY